MVRGIKVTAYPIAVPTDRGKKMHNFEKYISGPKAAKKDPLSPSDMVLTSSNQPPPPQPEPPVHIPFSLRKIHKPTMCTFPKVNTTVVKNAANITSVTYDPLKQDVEIPTATPVGISSGPAPALPPASDNANQRQLQRADFCLPGGKQMFTFHTNTESILNPFVSCNSPAHANEYKQMLQQNFRVGTPSQGRRVQTLFPQHQNSAPRNNANRNHQNTNGPSISGPLRQSFTQNGAREMSVLHDTTTMSLRQQLSKFDVNRRQWRDVFSNVATSKRRRPGGVQ
eukprot:TRINITY_DN67204_c6_g5_i1.p1 TRINITY_DN67204_c6_g5~~TRINITY_DN67204_c6_g5_i1.p1  ORF type:complete len:282 (-),score=16.02 TRINITY_DN67204_c6_g5_i1:439-1284(-)